MLQQPIFETIESAKSIYCDVCNITVIIGWHNSLIVELK